MRINIRVFSENYAVLLVFITAVVKTLEMIKEVWKAHTFIGNGMDNLETSIWLEIIFLMIW